MSKYLLKILTLVAVLYRDALYRESERAYNKVLVYSDKIERQHETIELAKARLADLHREKNAVKVQANAKYEDMKSELARIEGL